MSGLRIALLGGVPPVLGGGGVERQLIYTGDALERRGHSVKYVRKMELEDEFDVLHAIGNGADIWQNLQHWRRNPAPFISSPVIVCSPGASETKLMIGARLGRIPNVNSMTRDIVRRADRVIALTTYEQSVAQKLAGKDKPIDIVENGVELIEPSERPADLPEGPYVLMLGVVSERKKQRAIVERFGDDFTFVIVGGHEGPDAKQADFERLIAAKNAVWLGEIDADSTVRRVVADAAALVLFSDAEVQSGSVLEALAYGTPVVASAIPSHKELAARFPGWLQTAEKIDGVGSALKTVIDSPPDGPAPKLPTWDDIAEQVEAVYERALAKTSS